MPASALTAVDSPRPIQVHVYPPTPAGSKPRLPDALIDLFLYELSIEPHHNPFYCDKCGYEFTLALRGEGTTCTARQEGGHICLGKVTRRWTKLKAYDELLRLMAKGGVAVAWELARHPVPVGMMVCEPHCSDSVIAAIDFPLNVLGTVYGRLGREEPFLVVTHVCIVSVTSMQIGPLVEKLFRDVVEATMRQLALASATVLMPVFLHDTQPRQALLQMTGGKHQMLARDVREGRHRELWGIKFRAH